MDGIVGKKRFGNGLVWEEDMGEEGHRRIWVRAEIAGESGMPWFQRRRCAKRLVLVLGVYDEEGRRCGIGGEMQRGFKDFNARRGLQSLAMSILWGNVRSIGGEFQKRERLAAKENTEKALGETQCQGETALGD
jgi:hypothetical protein